MADQTSGRVTNVDSSPPGRTDAVAAILPSGRVVWLTLAPTPASATAVRDAGAWAQQRALQRHATIVRQRRAVVAATGALARDVRRLTDSRLERMRQRRLQMLRSQAALDRALDRARDRRRTAVTTAHTETAAAVTRLGRRATWDALLVASGLPLFAAFGQSGRPTSSHNVVLALSSLVWLVGDDVVDWAFGRADQEATPRDADIWSWIAPVGHLVSGWWLLADHQHERFVGGHTAVSRYEDREPHPRGQQVRYIAEVDLGTHVAAQYVDTIRERRDVVTLATVAAVQPSAVGTALEARVDHVVAEVRDGVLEMQVTVSARLPARRGRHPHGPLLDRLELLWLADVLGQPHAG